MDKAEKAAMSDMDDNVFKPILNPLSDNDRIFLRALAQCGGTVTTAELQAALGKNGPAIQPYRKRLIEAGGSTKGRTCFRCTLSGGVSVGIRLRVQVLVNFYRVPIP